MNQVAKKRFFENVAIIDIAEEGKGVGKSDEFVLFVDHSKDLAIVIALQVQQDVSVMHLSQRDLARRFREF